MTPVEWLAYFVNILVACSAMPIMEQDIQGHTYRVQTWVCRVDKGPVVVKAWQQACKSNNGYTYWGRTFYIKFEDLGEMAFYGNRFGEVQGGQGAQLGDAYQAPCGS